SRVVKIWRTRSNVTSRSLLSAIKRSFSIDIDTKTDPTGTTIARSRLESSIFSADGRNRCFGTDRIIVYPQRLDAAAVKANRVRFTASTCEARTAVDRGAVRAGFPCRMSEDFPRCRYNFPSKWDCY